MNHRHWTLWAPAVAGIFLGVYMFGALSHSRNLWPMGPIREVKQRFDPPRQEAEAEESGPKPIYDELRRLFHFPVVKEQVPCPDQDAETLVLLLIGQSNAANFHGQRHTSAYGGRVLNYFNGACYVAESPLLGASGKHGEAWTLLGNKLISAGFAQQVILVPAAVGASPISRWQSGGDLNEMLQEVIAGLVTRYRVTHVLWHQGEQDWFDGTSREEYIARFNSLVHSLRDEGIAAPVFVSVASRCGLDPSWTPYNAVAIAQRALPDPQRGIFSGPDTDRLLGHLDRHDDCHFAASGVEKFVDVWIDVVADHLRMGTAR